MKKSLFLLCTIWVVLFNNSRISPDSPTYDVLCWFRFPREIRYLEVLFLVGAYVACMQRPLSQLVRRVNVLTLGFLSVALVSLLASGQLGGEQVQEIYMRVVPFLFFIVAAATGVCREDVRRAGKFFLVVTCISIAVAALYQLQFHGDHADNIHGFFSDAHILGAVIAIVAVGCLSEFVETHRVIYLASAAGLIAFSLFPGNDKVVLLSGGWFALVFVKDYILRKGWLGRIVLGGAFALALVWGLANFVTKEDSPVRVFEIADFSVDQLGPIAAWPIAGEWLTSSGFTFVFGLGPGEYGWLAASRAVMEGGGSPAAQTFAFEFSFENTQSAGFLFRTNTWSSLLVELGVLGFLLFAAAFAAILYGVYRKRATDRFDRTLTRVFTFTLVAVMFQGFFTPFSNWSESILMFPLMYMAAYLVGRGQPEPQ
jgi:hypothetical protein